MKILLFAVVSLTISQSHADSWEALVTRLTQTRADLETLSKEAESIAREKQTDLDQWSQRRAEAEGHVQREKMRHLQMSEKLKSLEGRVKVSGKADPQAQKKLLTWIQSFEESVVATIPFSRDNRLKSLENLRERLAKNHEPVEFIFADFWAFVELELKLAQTNEYRIVDVVIAGQKRKCEVARLGLMALFVVTPKGQTLKATKEGGQWKWKDIESSAEQSSVISLINNLKKKNDSGIYQLPMNQEKLGASL